MNNDVKASLSAKVFIDDLKKLASTVIWKNQDLANKCETGNSFREIDIFILAAKGGLNFDNIAEFKKEDFVGFGYTEAFIEECIKDKYKIPSIVVDAVIERHIKNIIDNYEEDNNYYRMLNGYPDLEDTDFIYNTKVNSVSKTTPIHLLSDTDKLRLDGVGYIDELIAQYPKKKYLRYMTTNRIRPEVARVADRFALLKIEQTTQTNNMVQDFKDMYLYCRNYMVNVFYNESMKANNNYYEEFMAMSILFMTMQQMNHKYLETDTTRDFYDLESLKMVYDSYGVPFFSEIPLSYHKKIVKDINKLIQYKGSSKVIFDICRLFDYDSMELYQYYLVKQHKLDVDGNPIFVFDGDELKNDEMYDIAFAKVPVGEDPYLYITDEKNIISYTSLTSGDPYWIDDSELWSKLYNMEYNYLETKYIGIQIVMNLTRIQFESCYFLRMLADNREKTSELKVMHDYIGEEVPLFDLMIYACALICKQNGFEGNIPIHPEQIAKVYGFNFIDDLNKIRKDIENNPKIDNSVLNNILYMDINSLGDVHKVFSNIDDLCKEIEKVLISTHDKEVFYAYRHLQDTLLTTKILPTVYEKTDGTMASSFANLLEDINYVLFDRLQNEEVAKELSYVIFILEELSNRLTNLNKLTASDIETTLNYLFKMLNVFKSAKVDMTGCKIIYKIQDRGNELMKFLMLYWRKTMDSEIYSSGEFLDWINLYRAKTSKMENLTLQDRMDVMSAIISKNLFDMSKINLKDFVKSVHFASDIILNISCLDYIKSEKIKTLKKSNGIFDDRITLIDKKIV